MKLRVQEMQTTTSGHSGGWADETSELETVTTNDWWLIAEDETRTIKMSLLGSVKFNPSGYKVQAIQDGYIYIHNNDYLEGSVQMRVPYQKKKFPVSPETVPESLRNSFQK